MAILPLQLPRDNIDSRYDFSPLAALGKQWVDKRNEEEAAQLVAGLFAQQQQQQQQDAAAQQAAVPPQQAAPPRPVPPQAAPPGPLPPLQPSPVSPSRGLTRFGDAETVPSEQRIAAGHEAVTLDPSQRVEGGFEDLRRVIVDTPRAPVQAQGFAPEQPAAAAPADPMARANRAISSIESGGDYQKLGPVTRTGDRAYGKYQVMGKNVPDWTEKFFGQRLTPQQFIANPAAQDAVFNGQFGEYTQKYGPTGAAKAWFAGERGMNNPAARDMLGTSVSSYADKFNRNFGGLPPEITSGTSRPQAPEGLPASQALAFDKVTSNLANPRAPAGTASGISSAQIAALYRNPATRPIATAYLQKALSPEKFDFHVDADNIVRYNKANGTVDVMPLRGKPQVVGEGGALVSPTGQVLYGAGSGDAARYGKLPAGERWKDPNNKALGVEPIPGGEKEKIDADVAGRMGLAKKYLGEVDSIKSRLEAGELGVENTSNHLKGLGGLGAPGELRRKIDSGADALIRMLTGAGMPATEAADYARRYRLTARDTKDVLISKTNELTKELISVGTEIGKGRGGFEVPAGAKTAATAPAGGPEVGKVYHGRKYLGGPVGSKDSWSKEKY